jgi:HTH-type transcriptional regulator/antitoxin HipB
MMALARDARQIGNLIRDCRKRRGLSQSQLGTMTGLRQETISLIESGSTSARIKTLLAILAALDLELRVTLRTKGAAYDIEKNF